MRVLLGVLVLLFSCSLYAEDKVVIFINIDSDTPSEGAKANSSYTNAIFIGMNEFNDITFEKYYNLRVITKSDDSKKLNVVIALNQFIGEKLYYIGDKSIDFTIGETQKFELNNKKTHYKVTLSTSYGDADLLAKERK